MIGKLVRIVFRFSTEIIGGLVGLKGGIMLGLWAAFGGLYLLVKHKDIWDQVSGVVIIIMGIGYVIIRIRDIISDKNE